MPHHRHRKGWGWLKLAGVLGLIFSWMLIANGRLYAQVESGKIVGTIRDTSGAVLPGAKVTVTNAGTGVAHTVTTNESGDYVVTQLLTGTYAVTAEHTGFKKAEQPALKLDVNQVVRADFNLVVGEVTEKIEVTAVERLLESETSSIGQVIDENRVHDLPLVDRNFITLSYLSPGVNAGPPGIVQAGNIPENERGTGAIQVNGLMATNNNYLLNGFDNNEQQIGFNLIEPPLDAIQEFKVQTNNFGADIGKGGAVVNIALKTGTNQFHGTAFEFLRNSTMNAKNFFDNPAFPIAPFKQNQFGGTLGGPIVREKTFFFVDYQGTRIRKSLTDLSVVPTLSEERNPGNLSDLLPGQVITDPVTGAQFPNNTIPPCVAGSNPPRSATGGSCVDSAAVKVFALFPVPNVPGQGANNFLSNPVDKNNQDSFDVRVDHQVSSKNSLFGTFSYGNVDDTKPDPFSGVAGGGLFTGHINDKALSTGISDVHAFSANKINEFKIGYMRYLVDARPFFAGQTIAQQFGISGVFDSNNPQTTGGLPNFNISGYGLGGDANGVTLGQTDWFPEKLAEDNYQLLDSFTYVRGPHTFKVGGDLRRRQHGFFQVQNSRGDLSFTGQLTGNSLGDFLIGAPFSVGREAQVGTFGMKWWEFGTYLADDYRVSSKMTWNLGLRYDIYTPMAEDHNRLANFNFSTATFVAPGVTPGVSRSGNVETNLHNFAPRIGFAYTPWSDNKTVFRGGYGIFYDLQANQNDAELAYNPTPGVVGSTSFTYPGTTTPTLYLSRDGVPAAAFSTIANPSGKASAAFFHNPTTYIEEWNFNVERALIKDALFQVAYVGTHGVHLTYLRNLNQAIQPLDSNFQTCPPSNPGDPTCPGGRAAGLPSNFGRPYYSTVPAIAAIRTEGHDLSSITHSLQVRFEKRFSGGWSILNSYTYQHTIGQVEEDEFSEPQNTHNMRGERGSIEPDYRHQFTSAWTYELPFGPRRRFLNGGGPARWIAGGWQLNGAITLYSGRAITPFLSFDPTNTGSFGARPNVISDPNNFSNAKTTGFNGGPSSCPSNGQTVTCWFNPAAFALPAFAPGQFVARQFGNAGRGILVSPAQYNVDFSVFKDFRMKEKLTLQLRCEVFNLFNTPQFGDPSTLVDTSSAGSISTTIHDSRQLQVAARIIF